MAASTDKKGRCCRRSGVQSRGTTRSGSLYERPSCGTGTELGLWCFSDAGRGYFFTERGIE